MASALSLHDLLLKDTLRVGWLSQPDTGYLFSNFEQFNSSPMSLTLKC